MAASRPIPEPAPVTSATFSINSLLIFTFDFSKSKQIVF
jgi:hypothetical protein